jgi:multiple sugar transport system permease protein
MNTAPTLHSRMAEQLPVQKTAKREKRAGYGMLSPGLIVIGVVTIFPIFYSVWMSLNHIDLTENGFSLQPIGLKNYGILARSHVFWHSVWFTFYYAVVTVTIELVLGLLIAVAIQGVKYLKNVSVVVMLIPWALVTTVSAQMWAYIYNGVYGVLNGILQLLHLIDSPVAWLSSTSGAIIAMMVADIWKTTPFVVIILVAGLQMIPSELYEAAYIDGANGWQVFWRVTLPLLRGSLAVAGLFRILQAFGVFDLPFVLTNGGPGNATQSLAILGYEQMFNNMNFGIGSAIAVSTVVLVLAVCLIFLSAFKSIVTDGEGE